MRSFFTFLLAFPLVIQADNPAPFKNDKTTYDEGEKGVKPEVSVIKPVAPFTGKITKNRVRLRLEPSLEGSIVEESSQGQFYIIDGEAGEFYAVKPQEKMRVYVFRTFVLDGKVEGSKVNVRISPSIEGAIIGQLNTGDTVEGRPSIENNKWLEIAPPAAVRFFVAKEFVERVGDALFLSRQEEKRKQLADLLSFSTDALEKEWQKPFPQIALEPIRVNLRKVVSERKEFPDLAQRAEGILQESLQKEMDKKIAFLEERARDNRPIIVMQTADEKPVEATLPKETVHAGIITDKMAMWLPQEKALLNSWQDKNRLGTEEDFYKDERQNARSVVGVIEPYTRALKNRPGDFVLTHPENSQILVFLYSTKVNLQDYVGKKVEIQGAERPNNDFAFPAYFVLSVSGAQ